MITTDIKQLEINYLTEDQYNTAKRAGTLDENALYMTERTSIKGGIYCHATATSSSLSLSAGAIQGVPLNTLSINNPPGFFRLDISSNGVICGKPGTVFINGSVYVSSSTAGNMGVYIKKNSNEIACAFGYNNTVSSVSKIITVAAGDVITLSARSANVGTCAPNNYGTYLDIIYLDY